MDALALLNRLKMEAGVSGRDLTTLTGLSGEMYRLWSWLVTAWIDIQSIHQDWHWMRESMSFPTVAGQGVYTLTDMAITDHGKWAERTFRNYPTSVGTNGEMFMAPVEYDTWRDSFNFSGLRNTRARPTMFAVSPDKGICLGPIPASGYTITGDYWHAPVTLTAATDVPDFPEQYHMAIVWKALESYGLFEAAPEAKFRGETEFKKYLAKLERDRLTAYSFAGALA